MKRLWKKVTPIPIEFNGDFKDKQADTTSEEEYAISAGGRE